MEVNTKMGHIKEISIIYFHRGYHLNIDYVFIWTIFQECFHAENIVRVCLDVSKYSVFLSDKGI